jgi:signal transduction histidine kinase
MLIDGLLAFSKVVHGDTEVQRVELDAVLDDAIEVFADSIRDAGASVLRAPLPPVRGDALQLGQLWQNLLSNAIKYRRADVPLKVCISAVERGQAWVISVSDNGVGFRPEYAERIFGLFKRLHGREIPGTGVGLGICRRIVERYGGTISAVSEGEGQGATFSFTLPKYT